MFGLVSHGRTRMARHLQLWRSFGLRPGIFTDFNRQKFHTKKMNTLTTQSVYRFQRHGGVDCICWLCCSIVVLVICGCELLLKTCQQGIGQSPVPAVAVQRSSWRQDIEMQLMVPWDRFWIDVFLVCFLVCPLHFFRFPNFFQDSARWVKSFMKLCHWNQPFDRLHISHLQALSTITMVYVLHIT